MNAFVDVGGGLGHQQRQPDAREVVDVAGAVEEAFDGGGALLGRVLGEELAGLADLRDPAHHVERQAAEELRVAAERRGVAPSLA